jgi:amino acid adenylation domain-containing protein
MSAEAVRGAAETVRPAPLSFAQERLWFLEQLQPGTAIYNIPLALELAGEIDAGALTRSINELIARHDALRTVFGVREGLPVQTVLPRVTIALEVTTCTGATGGERLAHAQRLADAEAQRPFDLARGPLLRAALYRMGARSLLLLVIHHIAADAWSLGIVTRELAALYQAAVSGVPARLPLPALHYADYAASQRSEPAAARPGASLAYWMRRLERLPPPLELPFDRPRAALPSPHGAMFAFALPANAAARLKTLAAAERSTAFMVAFATFVALLHRYTGAADVVVGTPVANRGRAELEDVVGLFLNTLVLRVDAGGDPTFRELVRRVREVALDAFTHQDVPFEYLVQALQPERNLGVNPLFQVLFVHQSADGAHGAAAEPAIRVGTGTAKFDLSLYLHDTGSALSGAWEYRTAVFDEETIRRMSGHFAHLLDAATAEPDVPLSRLPLLTVAELDQLRAWNATERPVGPCAHESFERQAAATPAAAAVVFEDRTVTYAALNRQANVLARALRRLGVGPGVPVGICAERAPETIAGVLAILKAGGVHVPLDPAFPAERLAFMATDAAFPVVLTQRHLEHRLPLDRAVAVILLDDLPPCDADGDANLGPIAALDDLVYMLYTSGSTGRPKGTSLRHATLASLIAWQNRVAPAAPGARTLQYMSLSFDVSVIEIFATLAAGGTLVLPRENTRHDMRALAELIRETQVVRAFFPFTALQQLAKYAGSPEEPPLPLEHVISTGEALVVTNDVRRFFARHPACRLHNEYGPTETHWCTWHTLPEGDPGTWPALPPIGRCVDNAQVYVLDAALNRVPVGVAGELYAGGLCVAREYHRRPALTAERFVPDPFGGVPGARLYRTGDLARFRRDGSVEYFGRRDFQVKIRGFRVELGEIEATLAAHPDVAEAVASVWEPAAGDRRLVAYVRLKPGATPAAGELRAFLAERLPSHMVPAQLAFVDAFPLGATGKVDRRRLSPPEAARPDVAQPYVAPRGELEEALAALWAEILRIERPGAEDSFFELGGHSLLAAQIVARVRDAFAVDVPMQTIFERPTISALADEIVARQLSALGEAAAAELLDEIAELSDDEVRQALEADGEREAAR